MFSSPMEVDCCLEEFARVLVANGYINDDSCFTEADIPSMLNAFETPAGLDPAGLDPTDSFPVSPCGYGDLSRVLDIAQMASHSLLDSSLSDNLTYVKPGPCELYHVKSRDSYVGHSLPRDSHPHVDASFQNSICSNNVFVEDVDFHQGNGAHIGVNRRQKDEVSTTCKIEGSFHLLAHPSASPPASISCQLDLLHKSRPGCDLFPSPHVQHQLPLYPEISGATCASPLHSSAQVVSSRPKQKRKRRSKGYFKATKSKKRKTPELTVTPSQPKPKKQKVSKDNVHEQAPFKRERSASVDGQDIPQEDSGFESADGKMGKNAGNITAPSSGDASTTALSSGDASTTALSLGDASTTALSSGEANILAPLEDASSSENLECTEDSAPSTSLRRSSRTTRNPENYNFRLSSLVKRVETEKRQQTPRQAKDKTKPPPLSKYRRRTANARERDRMKEINDAFHILRASLPSIQRDDGKNKITKFTILKHALNYIASLRDVLGMEPVHTIHEDDNSSDFSSIRPGSVASFGAEDSCSSPTSGHSMTNHFSNCSSPTSGHSMTNQFSNCSSPTSGHSMTNQFSSQRVSLCSDISFRHNQHLETDATTQGIFLPDSADL